MMYVKHAVRLKPSETNFKVEVDETTLRSASDGYVHLEYGFKNVDGDTFVAVSLYG